MDIDISTDPDRLDVDMIHRYLSEESYWAQGIPREIVVRSLMNALCFGAYLGDEQVGLARVVTDRATFAYLADVFVVTPYQGQGIGKQLVQAVVEHPDLQDVRRILLFTRDAHSLYAQYGFEAAPIPERIMIRPVLGSYLSETEDRRP